ncbi:GNAT family N-acetyltransferase [Microcella daejeonensis]|uniref:GNAT family N-acetyltransferase n=1 Tax=Microcella daejeonensis TaxID=2994971 RepID=UPI00226F4902|nr:GNAT family N-acetyltransferase [Microcella daejeonensis]WAB83493.1 GNAT family N-acetyltransferase [Microcella daejeonensis]
MPTFSLLEQPTTSLPEVLALYTAVGWSAYTEKPDSLRHALQNSAYVVVARGEDGALIGLARAISDDATICYLQDVVVHPAHQRRGIGRALVDAVLRRFDHVRQTVLLTDDEPGQRAYYESLGLTEATEMDPGPLRAFVTLR